MNWKYLVYDIFKVIVPLVVAWLIPETAPQVEIITTVLYIFAAILGIDSIQKTVKAVNKAA